MPIAVLTDVSPMLILGNAFFINSSFVSNGSGFESLV